MINASKTEMSAELAAWCAEHGLPTNLTAEKLLDSPDSLTPSQRTWLRNFRDDYSDATEG